MIFGIFMAYFHRIPIYTNEGFTYVILTMPYPCHIHGPQNHDYRIMIPDDPKYGPKTCQKHHFREKPSNTGKKRNGHTLVASYVECVEKTGVKFLIFPKTASASPVAGVIWFSMDFYRLFHPKYDP